MREFKSLNPKDLPDGFDAEFHGEEPIVDIEEGKGQITVTYRFPGFYVSRDEMDVEDEVLSFDQLNIAATGFLAESGKPLLPSFGRYVQIPFGCDYTFTVKKGKPVQFDDVLVKPAQEMLRDGPEESAKVEFDKEFYAKDALYPEEIVTITGPFNIDDYQALLVHVCPFQYNPSKRELVGYGDVTVVIKVEVKEEEVSDYPFVDPEINKEGFGNLFLNPRRVIAERVTTFPKKVVVHPIGRGPEFLIIYHGKFKKATDELAKWKNTRGLITETVSINDIGNDVNKIKTYIRNKRKAFFSRLRYVLLFGDVDMIASEQVPDIPGYESPWGTNISDYYYSTPNDPTKTTPLVFPWLSIGRIPVRKDVEGMDVVNQVIGYEKNPPTDPDYYDRMAFAAYFQDGDNGDGDGKADRGYMQTMEYIRNRLLPLGFDIERIYVTNSPGPQFYHDGTPVPPAVVASIVSYGTATDMLINATSEGYLAIGHRDHGLDFGLGWHLPPFQMNHLDQVEGNVPSIFYSVNCQTGRFDLIAPTECFAEKILRMDGAAPSLIAPTRDSATWLNNSLIKALFDAMWSGVLPTLPGGTASYPVKYNRLGDILNYAKSYLPVAHTGITLIKDHFEIYHVIGDPTLELWKRMPLTVKLVAYLDRKWRSLEISMSSCPKGAVLTVWFGNSLLKKIKPTSTRMKISLTDIVPFERPALPHLRPRVYVCFAAPGYRFVRTKARVLPVIPLEPIMELE
jgi:hypothetical protein